MTSLDYQVLSRRIYSDFPVIGWLLRRWAAWQFSKDDGSGEAVAILAEVVTRGQDRAVREMALTVLNRLKTQDAINGFCRVWVETRHKDLAAILRSRRYVATEPRLRVLSALKVGALDVVKRGGVEVLDFLLAALSDRDTQVATAAASCVSALENRVVIDELCRRWVESRSSQLEGIIRQGGYVASQPVAVRVLTALKLNQIQEISDGGIEVLDCVLKAFDDRDMEVVRSANVCAVSLTNRGAIDELCKRWASSRNKQLEQIIQKGKYITSQSVETQFLVTLKFYPSQKIKIDSTEVLDYLLVAMSDRDNEIVKSANISITQIKDKNIIDILCKKWIDNPSNLLENIIRQSSYEPYEASTKALFYFLLGEWQKYEDLDFDQTLLSKAYYGASDSIQKLIADKAKMAGRIEWIKILTNTKKGFNVEEMTDNEWSNFIDILVAHPDRKEIWRFLYHAPVIWSKRLLDNLAKASCKWFRQDEENTVQTLLTLSRKSEEHDFILIPYLLIQIPCSIIQEYKQNGLMNHTQFGRCLAISPDGNILVLGNDDRTINLRSLPDGKHLKTLLRKDLDHYNYTHRWRFSIHNPFSLAINLDGSILASNGVDSGIDLWKFPNGIYLKTLGGHTGIVFHLSITPDGRILASGSADSTIRLWRLPDGNHLKTLEGHSDLVSSLSITPDGRILISSGHDGTIRLWSLPDGNLLKTLQGYTDSVTTLAISSDGCTLVSGSGDGTICLWSLPNGIHLKTLSGYNFINSVVTSPNEKFFVSASYDGMTRLWDLSGMNTNTAISRFTTQDIATIESQIKESTIKEDIPNALKFTLALIRLRQQFDIDIEDVSSNVQFSEFDIEIDG
jgi:WD40 repeat protein